VGENTFVIKLFKNTTIIISYKTKNTIGKLLDLKKKKKKEEATEKYNKNCINVLECPDRGKRYLGQPGRSLRIRFKEHVLSYKNQNSKFAEHLQEYHHSSGHRL
jgi:hypothetical protein